MENQLIKVEEFSSIMQTASESLEKCISSVSACNNAGQTLLDTIEGEGMTEELDRKIVEYITKVKVTISKMEDRRKPLTQLFDRIRSEFTSYEKAIDSKDGKTIPGRLVYARDQYAVQKRLEDKKRQEEAIRQTNIEKEKNSYKIDIETALNVYVNNFLTTQLKSLNNLFNAISLDNYDINIRQIREFPISYPQDHFNQFSVNFQTIYLDAQTKIQIKATVFAGKYDEINNRYRLEIEEVRQQFIDRLPSKLAELREIEELKKQNAFAAEKVEQERVAREKQESIRRLQEQKKKEEELKAKALVVSQSATMESLFISAATTVATAPINAKITEKIKVLHPSGFVDIYQMWWMNEGNDLTIEELEKIHKKMITVCEKIANKDAIHINSKYIRYEEDVKAK